MDTKESEEKSDVQPNDLLGSEEDKATNVSDHPQAQSARDSQGQESETWQQFEYSSGRAGELIEAISKSIAHLKGFNENAETFTKPSPAHKPKRIGDGDAMSHKSYTSSKTLPTVSTIQTAQIDKLIGLKTPGPYCPPTPGSVLRTMPRIPTTPLSMRRTLKPAFPRVLEDFTPAIAFAPQSQFSTQPHNESYSEPHKSHIEHRSQHNAKTEFSSIMARSRITEIGPPTAQSEATGGTGRSLRQSVVLKQNRESQQSDKENMIGKLENELQDAIDLAQSDGSALAKPQEQIAESEQQRMRAENGQKQAESTSIHLKREIVRLKDEKERLRKTVNDLEARSAEARQVQVADISIRDAVAARRKAEAEADAHAERAIRIHAENERLRKRCRELSTRLKTAEEKIQRSVPELRSLELYKQQLKEALEDATIAREQASRVQAEKAELEIKLRDKQMSLAELRSRMNREVEAEAKAQTSGLVHEMLQLQEQLDQVREQNKTLLRSASDENQNTKLDDFKTYIQKTLTDLSSKLDARAPPDASAGTQPTDTQASLRQLVGPSPQLEYDSLVRMVSRVAADAAIAAVQGDHKGSVGLKMGEGKVPTQPINLKLNLRLNDKACARIGRYVAKSSREEASLLPPPSGQQTQPASGTAEKSDLKRSHSLPVSGSSALQPSLDLMRKHKRTPDLDPSARDQSQDYNARDLASIIKSEIEKKKPGEVRKGTRKKRASRRYPRAPLRDLHTKNMLAHGSKIAVSGTRKRVLKAAEHMLERVKSEGIKSVDVVATIRQENASKGPVRNRTKISALKMRKSRGNSKSLSKMLSAGPSTLAHHLVGTRSLKPRPVQPEREKSAVRRNRLWIP